MLLYAVTLSIPVNTGEQVSGVFIGLLTDEVVLEFGVVFFRNANSNDARNALSRRRTGRHS